MKKLILFLFCIATLSSCSNDDDFTNTYLVTMPTEDVEGVPDEMVVGEVYEFTINYIRPTSCYAFYGPYYQDGEEDEEDENGEIIDKDFIRIIAPINIVYEENDCQELEELVNFKLDFSPREAGIYRFKFWTGTDENDEDTFLNIDVPVLEE